MKIVFDIDDTLNNLAKCSYELAGIEHSKYVNKKRYKVDECSELTADEQLKLIELWGKSSTYMDCSAEVGITEIAELAEIADVVIHSYCENVEVASTKMSWVSSHVKSNKLQFVMEVGKKTPLSEVSVVVEDNIAYLASCIADVKILINRNHNQSQNYNISELEHGITRVNSLKEAIALIRELIFHGKNSCKHF